MAVTLATPPRVVWLRLGTCSTAAVASVLQANVNALLESDRDGDARILVLGPGE
ncbi:MAG: hypothetical protein ABIP94_18480 [Planctomycetota bacterium]